MPSSPLPWQSRYKFIATVNAATFVLNKTNSLYCKTHEYAIGIGPSHSG